LWHSLLLDLFKRPSSYLEGNEGKRLLSNRSEMPVKPIAGYLSEFPKNIR